MTGPDSGATSPGTDLGQNFVGREHPRPQPAQHRQRGFLHLVAVRTGGVAGDYHSILQIAGSIEVMATQLLVETPVETTVSTPSARSELSRAVERKAPWVVLLSTRSPVRFQRVDDLVLG